MSDDFEVVTNKERCAKEQRIEELEAYCEELRTAGGILSNLLYNYAQSYGRTLVTGECQVMKRQVQKWDKVVKKDRP